jgi:hypothetical protein
MCCADGELRRFQLQAENVQTIDRNRHALPNRARLGHTELRRVSRGKVERPIHRFPHQDLRLCKSLSSHTQADGGLGRKAF